MNEFMGSGKKTVLVDLKAWKGIDCKTVVFCLFKYARAVKQKVQARKTLSPRFTDFFTDFEKKPTVLQSRKGMN